MEKLNPRKRDALIQSLRAGVVPRSGRHLIQVGRGNEIKALVKHIESVSQGGSAIRFIIGDYGSGKTFFLNLIRSIALEKGLVTAHADLAPDRRIYAGDGRVLNLYTELMRNLSTPLKPEGGAIRSVVERFIKEAQKVAKAGEISPEAVIHKHLGTLHDLLGGYDFAHAITAYYKGSDTGNEQLKSDVVRWLRGEFRTKTEARNALGLGTVVDDASAYDFLKLFSRFVVQAGFSGLLVCLDEMVNIYRLANPRARNSNYEQLLRIVNDNLQGGSEHLAFLFGCTPDSLTDTRRGIYSYAALESRLAENTLSVEQFKDYSGPVLYLEKLTPEDFYALLMKIREVYAFGDPKEYLLPDEAIRTFVEHRLERIGETYSRTPRAIIVAFVKLLAVLEQSPHADWQKLLGDVDANANQESYAPDINEEQNSALAALSFRNATQELASFKL